MEHIEIPAMQDQRIIINILEDSRDDLSRILVMQALIKDSLSSLSLKNCWKQIANIDISMAQLQKQLISEYIASTISTLNRTLKNNHELKGALFQFKQNNNCPYLMIGPDIITNFPNCLTKSEFDIFNANLKDYMKQGEEIASRITYNRQKFQIISKEALDEACQNNMVDSRTKLEYSFSLGEQYIDGIEILNIKSGNVGTIYKIDLTKEVNWDLENLIIKKAIIKQIKLHIEKNRNIVIEDFIKKTCDELKIRFVNLKVIDKMDKDYDFSTNTIYKFFNTNNFLLTAKFKNDLDDAVHAIRYLSSSVSEMPGKIHICLGDCNFFRFKEERIIDGNQYMIYESRLNKGKILLHIFENGRRLTNNKRTKTLRKFGFSRKNFQEAV